MITINMNYSPEKKQKSKCEQVVDGMLNLLSKGEYAPGDKLPPEAYFMERFDASRITIRESFKQLSIMGLVDIKRGSGTYVTCAEPASLVNVLLPCIVMNKDNVDEMFEARKSIEVAIAELACRKRTLEDIDKMKTCLTDMSTCIEEGNLERYTQLDNKFHSLMAKACHNSLLIAIYELLDEVRSRCIEYSNDSEESLRYSYSVHCDIFKALEQREEKYIGFLMVMHLNFSQSAANRVYGLEP